MILLDSSNAAKVTHLPENTSPFIFFISIFQKGVYDFLCFTQAALHDATWVRNHSVRITRLTHL